MMFTLSTTQKTPKQKHELLIAVRIAQIIALLLLFPQLSSLSQLHAIKLIWEAVRDGMVQVCDAFHN